MVSPHDFKTNLGYPFGDAFGLKKFAALLPNNWLAESVCAEEAWQTVGGKGADF
jgi:hypothetical protein